MPLSPDIRYRTSLKPTRFYIKPTELKRTQLPLEIVAYVLCGHITNDPFSAHADDVVYYRHAGSELDWLLQPYHDKLFGMVLLPKPKPISVEESIVEKSDVEKSGVEKGGVEKGDVEKK